MSDLSDFQICKRITEIEGFKGELVRKKCIGFVIQYNENFRKYNPLKDDALCFKLMVKYKVDIEFLTDCVSAYISDGSTGEVIYENINKAICLVIIEEHKEVAA